MVTAIISAGAVTNNFRNYRLLIRKCVRSKTPKALFASFRYHGQKLPIWQPMGICRIIAFFCHIVNKNQKLSIRSFFKNQIFQNFHHFYHGDKPQYSRKKSDLIFVCTADSQANCAVPNVLRLPVYADLPGIDEVYRRCTFAVPRCTGDVPLLYGKILL